MLACPALHMISVRAQSTVNIDRKAIEARKKVSAARLSSQCAILSLLFSFSSGQIAETEDDRQD